MQLRIRDLVDNDILPRGLDLTGEGVALLEQLVRNAEKVEVPLWLEWLTARNGLKRLASIQPDLQWIERENYSAGMLDELYRKMVFPCFESAGTVVAASIRGDEAWRKEWEQRLSKKILLVAATLHELRHIIPRFRLR